MPKFCVEPAHDDHGKDANHNSSFTSKKGDNEKVFFPHVDSCLGVVLLLDDGTVVTDHINGFFGGKFDAASHKAAFKTVTDKIGKKKVAKAVVFGDVDNWKGNLGKDFDKLGKPEAVQGGAKGLDVTLDLKTGDVNVAEYKKDRDFSKAMDKPKKIDLF